MKILNKSQIDEIVTLLNSGKVIILPTETVFGLMCIASSDNSKRLDTIKNRPSDKVYPIVSNLTVIKPYIKDYDDKLMNKLKDYSLTVILPLVNDSLFNKKGNTVGLRLSTDSFLNKIIDKVNKPLFLTSANISGQEPIKTIQEAITIFDNSVDGYVEGDISFSGVASTIIDLTNSKPSIIRQGSVKLEDIFKEE